MWVWATQFLRQTGTSFWRVRAWAWQREESGARSTLQLLGKHWKQARAARGKLPGCDDKGTAAVGDWAIGTCRVLLAS